VAVVGAGISGCFTAIQLADAGFEVVLIDRSGEAMSGPSRWNEGKIHLGYCYLRGPTLATAGLMLYGAASFVEGIERRGGSVSLNRFRGLVKQVSVPVILRPGPQVGAPAA